MASVCVCACLGTVTSPPSLPLSRKSASKSPFSHDRAKIPNLIYFKIPNALVVGRMFARLTIKSDREGRFVAIKTSERQRERQRRVLSFFPCSQVRLARDAALVSVSPSISFLLHGCVRSFSLSLTLPLNLLLFFTFHFAVQASRSGG